MKRVEHRNGWGGQPAKYCYSCRRYRLLKFFWSNKARWDGKSHRCIFCEKTRQGSEPYKSKHGAYHRVWRAANHRSVIGYGLKSEYGIDIERYEFLLAEQGGVCAICHKPETEKLRGKIKRLAVDHDHETSLVRGLLCGACNQGIGFFGDDRAKLASALAYLEKHARTYSYA